MLDNTSKYVELTDEELAQVIGGKGINWGKVVGDFIHGFGDGW